MGLVVARCVCNRRVRITPGRVYRDKKIKKTHERVVSVAVRDIGTLEAMVLMLQRKPKGLLGK